MKINLLWADSKRFFKVFQRILGGFIRGHIRGFIKSRLEGL